MDIFRRQPLPCDGVPKIQRVAFLPDSAVFAAILRILAICDGTSRQPASRSSFSASSNRVAPSSSKTGDDREPQAFNQMRFNRTIQARRLFYFE